MPWEEDSAVSIAFIQTPALVLYDYIQPGGSGDERGGGAGRTVVERDEDSVRSELGQYSRAFSMQYFLVPLALARSPTTSPCRPVSASDTRNAVSQMLSSRRSLCR